MEAVLIDINDLLARIPEHARVLDLGGWDRVFPRANVVADLNPYETRKIVYPDVPERFTEKEWIIADFCSPEFWEKIPDKAFDFITISHTLEDIRDPLYVCSQMIRCAHAGYIEGPSKFRELSKINKTDTFSGYAHHRWIIEPMPDLTGLQFKAKLAWAHHEDYLGDERRHLLNDYFHHFDGYFWTESFKYVEHFAKGMGPETIDARWYFKNCVLTDRQRRNIFDLVPNQSSHRDGKCIWASDYILPSHYEALHGRKPDNYMRYYGEPEGFTHQPAEPPKIDTAPIPTRRQTIFARMEFLLKWRRVLR